MKRWHFRVRDKLKEQFSPFLRPRMLKISHPSNSSITTGYNPDIVIEKDGKLIIIEIESYAQPGKIIEDLVYSFLAKARELVVIFSNKQGRGSKRVKSAKNIEKMMKANLPIKLQTEILWIEDENDDKLTKLCSKLAA